MLARCFSSMANNEPRTILKCIQSVNDGAPRVKNNFDRHFVSSYGTVTMASMTIVKKTHSSKIDKRVTENDFFDQVELNDFRMRFFLLTSRDEPNGLLLSLSYCPKWSDDSIIGNCDSGDTSLRNNRTCPVSG